MIGLLPHMGVHQFKITQRRNAYYLFALIFTLDPLPVPLYQHLLFFFSPVYGVQCKVVLRSFVVVGPCGLEGFPILRSCQHLLHLFHIGIIGSFQGPL